MNEQATISKRDIKIVDKTCVNSKWIARWLAKEDQECCQCIVSCKIKVEYNGYVYVMTEKEYKKLSK